jgi:hypothetical protein
MGFNDDTSGGSDWREWSVWVKEGIKALQSDIKNLEKEITSLKVETAVTKTKMVMWGGAGAAVVSAVAQLVLHLLKAKGGTP